MDALDGVHLNALHHRRLVCVRVGDKDFFHACFTRCDDHGQHAVDAAQVAAERELADKGAVAQIRLDIAGKPHQIDRNGQIVDGTLLFDVGRRKVEDKVRRGQLVAAVGQRRAHAVAALLDGGVGQSHQIKAGQSHARGALHLNAVAVDSVDAEACTGYNHK